VTQLASNGPRSWLLRTRLMQPVGRSLKLMGPVTAWWSVDSVKGSTYRPRVRIVLARIEGDRKYVFALARRKSEWGLTVPYLCPDCGESLAPRQERFGEMLIPLWCESCDAYFDAVLEEGSS
jgi:hypothetical protein